MRIQILNLGFKGLSAIPKQGLHSPTNNAAVTIEMPMATGKDLYLLPISLLSFYSLTYKARVLFLVNICSFTYYYLSVIVVNGCKQITYQNY